MTTGIIQLCGGWGGNLCGPTRFNPKGQFENLPIVRGMVKPFLKGLGFDPLGQKPLPDPKIIENIATPELGTEWNRKITNEIRHQGFQDDGKRQWFYKGAKLCLIWQLWHAAFPKAKWIITHRNDQLIINSCMNTSFMKSYSTPEGWQSWINHHKECFKKMDAAGLDIHYIDTEKIIRGEYEELRSAIKDYGLEWNEEGVNDFISPKIWQTVK